ncbi:MAG: BlaI/MecI/CopY family transcriptional regulator [Bacteroidetes bacterium]|nr:BlaI/MecI/CopY family transcriptional regulator [Bacteroidota bacterium]
MKELTKAEEQIMHILWKLEKAFVNDIVEKMPEPKPAYNTVSTIVRILERKGFVGYKAYGKTHEYFPLVQKEEYTSKFFNGFLKNYFDNSFQNMVSFFSKDKNLSSKEMEEIIKILESEVQKTKQNE